jgi:cysteine desulfurase
MLHLATLFYKCKHKAMVKSALKRLYGYFSKKRIYLDYASLTPIDLRVVGVMNKYSMPRYANPSSFCKEGVVAKKALSDGRARVAGFLHAQPGEIVFTSGGTESNNLAIIGAVEALHEKGVAYEDMHIIVSAIEHSSVRECANYLSGKGVVIDAISVDESGIVVLDELKKKLRDNTVIVSIMTVNNEIGSVQPIREIVKMIRHFRLHRGQTSMQNFDFQSYQYPIFHTDASQAALYEDLNVEKLGVDLLTLDGTKVYGPRGIGALYIRRDTPIVPIIYGGGQESGRRSGTENIPAIMGLAKALDIAGAEREKETERVAGLKAFFIEKLKEARPDLDFKVNGASSHSARRDLAVVMSPHILNIFIPKIDNEFFVLQLDAKGISCSTKSSCLRDEDESYVLKSIGADSRHSVRFSFGRWTTKGEIDRTIAILRLFC